MENNQPVWIKSSRCGSGTCVEVAPIDTDVLMRDGKHPEQPAITFDSEGWRGFLDDIRSGRFADL